MIINSLYDFFLEKGNILPMSLLIILKEWYKWDEDIFHSARNFIIEYGCLPNIVKLSSHFRSQIEYVTSISPKQEIYVDSISEFLYSDVFDYELVSCCCKFQIDESLPEKYLILLHEPNDNDDDFSKRTNPINMFNENTL